MNIFAKFKRNDDAINNGKLLVLGTKDGKDIGILVARIHESNKRFDDTLSNLRKARQKDLTRLRENDEDAFNEAIKTLTAEVVCETCIVGWQGLTDADGSELVYNDVNIKRIRDELPELFEQILQFGSDSSNYVGNFDEAGSVKN